MILLPGTCHASVALSKDSISTGVKENVKEPTFSATCLLFFAPEIGSTYSLSINHLNAT
jgi:hypothetical protein